MSSPEKIGVLFLQAQSGFGADAAVHADIMRQLDRDRFRVHVACTGGDGAGEPDALRILRAVPNIELRVTRFAPTLGRRDARSLGRAALAGAAFSADFVALRRYVMKHGIRIVHSAERPRDAAYNLALSKLTAARSVVHIHVKWSHEYSRLARTAVQHADALFSISRYVTGTLVEMGRAPESIYTVLNGIDTARFDPSIDGLAFRREFGVAEDALVLASVSRLFSWKGQRELIRAFAQVHGEFPSARLFIVGADAREVEGTAFSVELKALARELGVEKEVIFTGPRPDVPRVMAACDVFTMPSFEEPFGLVFLEAMAMKRPVVALDNGGTPEVVVHGETGLLSPAQDIGALAANIRALLADRARRERMGELGRERALKSFTSRRMAEDAGAAYERILAQR